MHFICCYFFFCCLLFSLDVVNTYEKSRMLQSDFLKGNIIINIYNWVKFFSWKSPDGPSQAFRKWDKKTFSSCLFVCLFILFVCLKFFHFHSTQTHKRIQILCSNKYAACVASQRRKKKRKKERNGYFSDEISYFFIFMHLHCYFLLCLFWFLWYTCH